MRRFPQFPAFLARPDERATPDADGDVPTTTEPLPIPDDERRAMAIEFVAASYEQRMR